MGESKKSETDVLPGKGTATLSGAERAAALLLAIGLPKAGEIVQEFDPDEVRQIARTASKLGTVTDDDISDLVAELTRTFESEASLSGSEAFAEQLLLSVLPEDMAAEFMAEVRGSPGPEVWKKLAELPPEKLGAILSDEHPQVAAFVVAQLSTEQAAKVLLTMKYEDQAAISQRMIVSRVPPEHVLKLLEKRLADRLKEMDKAMIAEGASRLGKILNRFEPEEANPILEDIDEFDPEIAKAVRQKLFRFQDLARLDIADLRQIVEALDTDQLVVALSDVAPEFRETILSALYARARRVVEQELGAIGNVDAKNATEVRRNIAGIALEMAEQGTIRLKNDD